VGVLEKKPCGSGASGGGGTSFLRSPSSSSHIVFLELLLMGSVGFCGLGSIDLAMISTMSWLDLLKATVS
jgi:hypothetical protein